jgi:hypothetical protein
LTLIGLKKAVLVFGRTARAIERRYFFKELLDFAGFLRAEFDRGHIAALRRIIDGCKWAPRTAHLLGIRLFFELRRTQLSKGWGFRGGRAARRQEALSTSDASRGRCTMGFGPFLVKAKSGERDIGGGDGVPAQPRAIPAHLVSLESRRTNDPFCMDERGI